jgi:heat shock protein HslJ
VILGGVAAAGSGNPAAPTGEELASATYRGIEESPVVLVNGHWEGEPAVEGGASVPRVDLAPGFRVTGDLDGDGRDEAVALLHYNFGGSGVFSYLAVVSRDADGQAMNLATTEIGDRVQLRSAAIRNLELMVETVEGGPEDAACCPGQKRRRAFALDGGELVERSNEDHGRLSLSDLEGETWRLTHWAADEPVAEGIDIDLAFEGARIAGRSGCNRYQGSVEAGELAGDVSVVSPLAGTRMACPPPIDDAESRYLGDLQTVDRFRFAAGKLVLDWSDGDQWGSLTFEAAGGSTHD